MATKDQQKEQRAVIHPDILSRIEAEIPKFERDSGISGVVNRLVFEGLDSRVKLSGHPGRFSYSNSSNSFEESVRETFLKPQDHQAFLNEQKKALEKESPAFSQFWEIYQTAPNKASNQSKKKAVLAWKEALKKQKPHLLIEAAKRAVKDQVSKTARDEWTAPFPDAYRWLRDECFTVHLEAHATAEQPKVIPGQTVL